MPEVIGPFKVVISTQDPVGVHVSHLRHLSSTTAACRLLEERFLFPSRSARETAQLLSAHVAQALSFHEHSLKSTQEIRPMLQYYSYLNLAVAVVLAYRPPHYEQYRQHGIEDRSHALRDLDLKSVLVKAKNGAVPLFHSLLSHESMSNRPFRLKELLGAIPLVRYELTELFSLPTEVISVKEAVQETSKGTWKSHVTFECRNSASITRARAERAMPSLGSLYALKLNKPGCLEYVSKDEWDMRDTAILWHKKACILLTNYGGHIISLKDGLSHKVACQYTWHGLSRKPLIPTLTASLLLSFGLASVSRYRPALAARIRESRVNLLLDTFVNEADSMVIPAMRNLLFREEMVVSTPEAV